MTNSAINFIQRAPELGAMLKSSQMAVWAKKACAAFNGRKVSQVLVQPQVLAAGAAILVVGGLGVVVSKKLGSFFTNKKSLAPTPPPPPPTGGAGKKTGGGGRGLLLADIQKGRKLRKVKKQPGQNPRVPTSHKQSKSRGQSPAQKQGSPLNLVSALKTAGALKKTRVTNKAQKKAPETEWQRIARERKERQEARRQAEEKKKAEKELKQQDQKQTKQSMPRVRTEAKKTAQKADRQPSKASKTQAKTRRTRAQIKSTRRSSSEGGLMGQLQQKPQLKKAPAPVSQRRRSATTMDIIYNRAMKSSHIRNWLEERESAFDAKNTQEASADDKDWKLGSLVLTEKTPIVESKKQIKPATFEAAPTEQDFKAAIAKRQKNQQFQGVQNHLAQALCKRRGRFED